MTFLSIDVGTSAVKVALVDDELRELQGASAGYRYVLLPGERVELEPQALVRAVGQAVGALDPGLRRGVDVVCYDAFSPSPVFLTASGELAYPNVVTHLDRRSREESADVLRRLGGDRFLAITGLRPFVGGCGLLALLWMMRHEPDVVRRVHRVGHLTTYLHHLLTGEWTTDRVNASMFGAFETVTGRGWSPEIVEAFGLREQWFCEPRRPGVPLGALRAEAATLLGLRAGTPVAVGTNDMAAVHVGAGNERAGAIVNAAGSSEMVSVLTDVPAADPHYYLRCAATPGLWQIYATTAGGFALEWFREQLARDVSQDEFYGTLVPSAVDRYLDDDTVTFRPYLSGDRQSLEPRTGGWDGLTLGTTREQMLVAMMRAMVRVLAEAIRRAGVVTPLEPLISVSGGLGGDAFLALKRRELPGFEFRRVANGAVLGNVRLVQRASDDGAAG